MFLRSHEPVLTSQINLSKGVCVKRVNFLIQTLHRYPNDMIARLLIATTGGHFPRACPEPPTLLTTCGDSRFMLLPLESPSAVPINRVMLRMTEREFALAL